MVEEERDLNKQFLPLTELTSISPIDGRYAKITTPLREYFSEFALIRGRVGIEIAYLEALSQAGIVRQFTPDETRGLRSISENFDEDDARSVKQIEKKTRHDVKATEYFVKNAIVELDMSDVVEMVHFAMTSEDITNLAQNIAIRDAKDTVLVPSAWGLVDTVVDKVEAWKDSPAILGRTHGREAAGTTMSKELALFGLRLAKKIRKLEDMQLTGKLNGVIGNFHELTTAYPNRDWIGFSQTFIESLGLEPLVFTTQIEPHDRWAELFHTGSEIMTVLESMDQNLWFYMAQDYLFLPPREGETGSSVMPHKGRNMASIESSEGNAIVARGMFDMFATELPNSRLQRHLSDSTIARNVGVAFGHALVAFEYARVDLRDFQLREDNIRYDIDDKWSILTSGVQTKLRALGLHEPYEQLAALVKSGPVSQDRLKGFIDELPIDEGEKKYLLSLAPASYIGKADELTDMMLDEIRELKGKR